MGAQEDLGGAPAEERWSRVADREERPSPSEVLEQSRPADEQQTYTRGQGHRTRELGRAEYCVVCGDDWVIAPDEQCPGPQGVAL